MSITTLKLLLRAGALLAYWWLCLAVWTMDGNTVRACVPALLVGVSLLFIWLGPITGALAMILLGMSAEALSQLPAGRLVFAAAVTGLVLLHLSRLQNWSPIGRGLLMSIVGAFLWVGLLAFFQTPADDLPEVWAHRKEFVEPESAGRPVLADYRNSRKWLTCRLEGNRNSSRSLRDRLRLIRPATTFSLPAPCLFTRDVTILPTLCRVIPTREARHKS